MAVEQKTRGQKFFDEHVGYLMSRNIAALVENQYTPDAILISPFDVLDVPPPHIIPAGPQMVEFFTKWLDYHGNMSFDELYDFAELEDTVSFQALMTSETGKWVLGEAWHLAGDKIDRHYGFAHRLSAP